MLSDVTRLKGFCIIFSDTVFPQRLESLPVLPKKLFFCCTYCQCHLALQILFNFSSQQSNVSRVKSMDERLNKIHNKSSLILQSGAMAWITYLGVPGSTLQSGTMVELVNNQNSREIRG